MRINKGKNWLGLKIIDTFACIALHIDHKISWDLNIAKHFNVVNYSTSLVVGSQRDINLNITFSFMQTTKIFQVVAYAASHSSRHLWIVAPIYML